MEEGLNAVCFSGLGFCRLNANREKDKMLSIFPNSSDSTAQEASPRGNVLYFPHLPWWLKAQAALPVRREGV